LSLPLRVHLPAAPHGFLSEDIMDLSFLIGAACADNGALLHWAVGGLAASVAASALANLRNHVPPSVIAVIDVLALNFIKTAQAEAEAKQANPSPK
jgi:hypothetical protein